MDEEDDESVDMTSTSPPPPPAAAAAGASECRLAPPAVSMGTVDPSFIVIVISPLLACQAN